MSKIVTVELTELESEDIADWVWAKLAEEKDLTQEEAGRLNSIYRKLTGHDHQSYQDWKGYYK